MMEHCAEWHSGVKMGDSEESYHRVLAVPMLWTTQLSPTPFLLASTHGAGPSRWRSSPHAKIARFGQAINTIAFHFLVLVGFGIFWLSPVQDRQPHYTHVLGFGPFGGPSFWTHEKVPQKEKMCAWAGTESGGF